MGAWVGGRARAGVGEWRRAGGGGGGARARAARSRGGAERAALRVRAGRMNNCVRSE